MTTPHPPGPYRDDAEIERIARQLLDWAVAIPVGTVMVSVHDRAVFLSGTVTWSFQRDAADHAVCDIEGISTVRNEIAVLRSAPSSRGSARRTVQSGPRARLFSDGRSDAAAGRA